MEFIAMNVWLDMVVILLLFYVYAFRHFFKVLMGNDPNLGLVTI
jgi:hypothetical protein